MLQIYANFSYFKETLIKNPSSRSPLGGFAPPLAGASVSAAIPRRPTFVSPPPAVRLPAARRSSSHRPSFVSPPSDVRLPTVRRSSDKANGRCRAAHDARFAGKRIEWGSGQGKGCQECAGILWPRIATCVEETSDGLSTLFQAVIWNFPVSLFGIFPEND